MTYWVNVDYATRTATIHTERLLPCEPARQEPGDGPLAELPHHFRSSRGRDGHIRRNGGA